MTESIRRFLVAYDVADDRRRAAIAKLLSGFGERLQFSVFAIDASPAQFIRLDRRLCSLIDPAVDSLLYCDVGTTARAARRLTMVGAKPSPADPGPYIV